MRKIGVLLIISILASCGGPELPMKVENIKPVADTLVNTVQQDTIPTIVLSKPKIDNNLFIQISDTAVTLKEGVLAYNNRTGAKDISLTIEDGKISYLLIEGEQLIGTNKKEFEYPCELLPDGRVRVKHGATLSFIARCYGVTVRRLQRCNTWITDQNYIQAGEVLVLNCECKLCDD